MDEGRKGQWNPCVTANIVWIVTILSVVVYILYVSWQQNSKRESDRPILPPPPIPPPRGHHRSH